MGADINYTETRNTYREQYDAISDSIGSMPPYFFPTAARFVGPVNGCLVVDLGCGNGHLLRQLITQNPNARVVGLDFSRALLANAQARVPSGAFCLGDLNTTVPLADGSCDVVILSEVYEHLLQPRQLLSEIRRILKPTGMFVMTFPNVDSFVLYRKLGNRLVSAAQRFAPLKNFLPYEHPIRSSQPVDEQLHYRKVIDAVRAAGFDIPQVAGSEIWHELFAIKGLRHFDYFHPRLRLWLSHLAVQTGHPERCYRIFLRCKPSQRHTG